MGIHFSFKNKGGEAEDDDGIKDYTPSMLLNTKEL